MINDVSNPIGILVIESIVKSFGVKENDCELASFISKKRRISTRGVSK